MLFIDEIHHLSPVIEEILCLQWKTTNSDRGLVKGSARSIKLDLPPFTLCRRHYRAGLLTSPLHDDVWHCVQRFLNFIRLRDSTLLSNARRI